LKRSSVRAKGKEFEKAVGKRLGVWWWGEPFPRAYGSGSSTTLSKGDVFQGGDLYVPKNFPWSVECKAQEGWTLDSMFVGRFKLLEFWWEQTCRDAEKVKKRPMLVFTRNFAPVYILVRSLDTVLEVVPVTINRCIIRLCEDGVTICIFEQFLELVIPGRCVEESGEESVVL